MSQKQMTSSMAVVGAIIGAVLALFLITIFTIVLLTARKVPPATYADKMIDLPPTHKAASAYSDGAPCTPLGSQAPHVASLLQAHRMEKCFGLVEGDGISRLNCRELQSRTHQPLSYQEWICHQNGADRVYINHREHYV